jgi:hypothetical protein
LFVRRTRRDRVPLSRRKLMVKKGRADPTAKGEL